MTAASLLLKYNRNGPLGSVSKHAYGSSSAILVVSHEAAEAHGWFYLLIDSRRRDNKIVLRGTIVNRTYGMHKNLYV